jgi:hypothetical protein
MENTTIQITFHPDTMEMDVDAPELRLDVVISFLQRALRQCENAEKVVVAQQMGAVARDAAVNSAMNEQRTRSVLSKLKM